MVHRHEHVQGHFSGCELRLLDPRLSTACWYAPWRTFLQRRVILTSDLTWHRPDGSTHRIPAGESSDGASVPVWAMPFLPSRFDTLEAGIYHDHLCRAGHDLQWCDAEFRQALKALGVSATYSWLMYMGLRLASPWRNRSRYSWLAFWSWLRR